MINTNCWRQPIPVSVFELPTVARLIYQELLLNAARNDNGGSFTINKHHYKLEHGQCFFSDLGLAKILNRDRKTIEKWRKYLEKMGNRVGNRVGNSITPLIRTSPTQDGRIYTLLDYDKVIGMGTSSEASMGNRVGNRVGTDIRLQNTDTSTYAPAEDPNKITETQKLIVEKNGEKEMQPILLAQEPFLPKVPQKGISPVQRSDALVALMQIGSEYGKLVRWDGYEKEIQEAVDKLGIDQLLQAMRDYCVYLSSTNFTSVDWLKFKSNRLNKLSPKEQIERVKKAPEYLQDQSKKWDKRGSVSYTSLPNMQKLSQIYTGVQQEPMDEEKRAFVERSKVLHSKLQRPGLTVRFGMLYADKDLYENVSNAEIIELSNKVIDKKISEAKLNKITKNEIRVDRSDLKECLANINRLKSLENVPF